MSGEHPVEVLVIETPSLGDRSYVVTDGETGVVIDLQRDIDRVLAITEPAGIEISHVLETHIHNDYITGGHALAQRTGADYLVSAADNVSFDRTPVQDGDGFRSGSMRLRAIATPGHTFTHLAYVVETETGEAMGVFTGGSLLYGSTGRPDLLGAEHAATLARHQHASAHRLVHELPGATPLYPTHGFGSFCSARQAQGTASTLAQEQQTNFVLTMDEASYVSELLDGLDTYPAYYGRMAQANAEGPAEPDLRPLKDEASSELQRRIHAGEWVIDLRPRSDFAAGHLAGSINIGLDGNFISYLGWLLKPEESITLLADTAEAIAAAQRDLVRIGMGRPAAVATGHPEAWSGTAPLATLRTSTFADLSRARSESARAQVVLDVRRDGERRISAVAGSMHIPLHELLQRMDEVPTEQPVWVHCAAGYRAAIAASLMARAGRTVTAIDDVFESASVAGLFDHDSR